MKIDWTSWDRLRDIVLFPTHFDRELGTVLNAEVTLRDRGEESDTYPPPPLEEWSQNPARYWPLEVIDRFSDIPSKEAALLALISDAELRSAALAAHYSVNGRIERVAYLADIAAHVDRAKRQARRQGVRAALKRLVSKDPDFHALWSSCREQSDRDALLANFSMRGAEIDNPPPWLEETKDFETQLRRGSFALLDDSLSRIGAWLASSAPVSHALLRPPASESEIDAIDRLMPADHLAIPRALRALYRWHDGMVIDPVSRASAPLIHDSSFLSVEDALGLYARMMKKNFEGDSNHLGLADWNPRWFPFLSTKAGDLWVIDLSLDSPEAGAIIALRHFEPKRSVQFASVGAFIEAYAVGISQGLMRVLVDGSIDPIDWDIWEDHCSDFGQERGCRDEFRIGQTFEAIAAIRQSRPRCDPREPLRAMSPRMAQALRRLEAAFVVDGALRDLVLFGARLESRGPSPLASRSDVRAWQEWRIEPSPHSGGSLRVDVPTADGVSSCALLWVEDQPSQRAKEEGRSHDDYKTKMANLAIERGRPDLVPILEEFFFDPSNGTIVRVIRNDDPSKLVEEAPDLPTFLERIAEHYERRAARRAYRFELSDLSTFQRTDSLVDLTELAVGTLLAFGGSNDGFEEQWIGIKLEAGMSWSFYDATPEFDRESPPALDELEDWIEGVRSDKPEFLADSGVVERFTELVDGYAWLASIHTWKQPSIESLIERLGTLFRVRLQVDPKEVWAPSNETEVLALEKEVGDSLPHDLRIFMLSMGGRVESRHAVYYNMAVADVQMSIRTRRTLLHLGAEQFGPEYWDEGFVPVLDRGNADVIYVDTNGILGPPGCVVDFNHEDPSTRRVLFDSMTQWLECLVDGIESGLFVEDEGAIAPRDFIAEGSFEQVEKHDRIRTYGIYPYVVSLPMEDRVGSELGNERSCPMGPKLV